MKKNNFTEMFYKNEGYIVVVLISLVYVASSLINISKSGRTVYEIIGAGVLSLIVGIMINGVFRSIGIRRGDEDERTIATNELHARTVEEISPYIDKLDEFCEMENKRALREIRTRILAREGMKYSDFFDDEGNAVNAQFKMQISDTPRTRADRRSAVGKVELMQGNEGSRNAELTTLPPTALTPPFAQGRLEGEEHRHQGRHLLHRVHHRADAQEMARERAYKKALRVKLKPLLASNLTSDGVKASDPFDFGKSKKEYTTQRNASDAVIKVLMAIIFGYFGVSLASEINVASIIWNGLQIVLYVTGGVIQMYNSFMWVVDDYRGSIIKKIDYLQKFKIYAGGKENESDNG